MPKSKTLARSAAFSIKQPSVRVRKAAWCFWPTSGLKPYLP
jgi:hypothetical protein